MERTAFWWHLTTCTSLLPPFPASPTYILQYVFALARRVGQCNHCNRPDIACEMKTHIQNARQCILE